MMVHIHVPGHCSRPKSTTGSCMGPDLLSIVLWVNLFYMGLIYSGKYILIRPCVRLRLIRLGQSTSPGLHYFDGLNHQAAL